MALPTKSLHPLPRRPEDVYGDCVVSTERQLPGAAYTETTVITHTSRSKPQSKAVFSEYGINYLEEWEYDKRGNQIFWQRDENGDGSIDASDSLFYDEWQRLITHAYDEDGDDASDVVGHFYYSPYGDLIRIEADGDGDGEIDSVEHYTIDGFGQPVKKTWTDSQGEVTGHAWCHWHRGNLVRVEHDGEPDGELDDSVHHYVRNDDGLVVRFEVRDPRSGSLQRLWIYEYDSANRLVRSSWPLFANAGEAINVYDEYGRLIEVRTNDIVTRYVNDCPHPPTPPTPRP